MVGIHDIILYVMSVKGVEFCFITFYLASSTAVYSLLVTHSSGEKLFKIGVGNGKCDNFFLSPISMV